ncbi:MAG: hypothetical protein IJO22_05270 [Oscillospiraceae bacterium]|nr:hypothetical protein [Oscillospiraceae bacterium]
MKKIICLMLVLTMMLTACSKWNVEIVDPTEPSESIADLISGEQEETEEVIPVYPPTEDMLSIDATGLLRYKILYYNPFENSKPDSSERVEWANDYPMIYIYEPYQCKYEVFEYRAENAEATLNQLVNETINRLNNQVEKESFKVSVSVHKNMAVVDFYDTTDAFWNYLSFEKSHDEFLNSIAMTLFRAAGYDPGFTLEGGKQFKTDFVELEDDGYGRFEPVDLYAEISGEEYAELRATFPYDDSWRTEVPRVYGWENVLSTAYDDSVTIRPEGMDILLFVAGKTGVFSSPDEVSDRVKVEAATGALDCIESFYGEETAPPAKAISEAVMDDFIPKEWVEEFTKDLFGPDAEVEHTSTDDYKYHAEVGVYTPPHRGGWADYFPYVFEVKETAEGYEAEVAYLYVAMNAYSSGIGRSYVEIDYDYSKLEDDPVAMDFIENKLARYKINFKKTSKGELYFASCEKLPVNTEAYYFDMMQNYIAPIHYLAVGELWNDINEVPLEYLLAAGFSNSYSHYPNAGYLNEYYKIEDYFPENPEGWMFESFTKYSTEIPVEKLRELPYYDSKSGNYVFPEGFCFGEERYPVVTDIHELGDNISIFYDIIDAEGNIIGKRELRITNEDEGWRRAYLGCCERE